MGQTGRPMTLAWRKSKFSEAGNCVEVARSERWILVRDSKEPEFMTPVTAGAWRRFIGLIKENHQVI